ncbi:hypothetical protein WJX79_010476 [Trebouxia sp. C0005]
MNRRLPALSCCVSGLLGPDGSHVLRLVAAAVSAQLSTQELGAIIHLADMARGNVILLESDLCATQSVGMPNTCGLSLTLQSCQTPLLSALAKQAWCSCLSAL